MRITLDTTKTLDGLFKAVQDIKGLLLGRITFGENIQSTTKTITFTAANTEVLIPHGLGVIPTAWIGASDVATNIYKGTTPWTAQQISLKSSIAPAVVALIII